LVEIIEAEEVVICKVNLEILSITLLDGLVIIITEFKDSLQEISAAGNGNNTQNCPTIQCTK